MSGPKNKHPEDVKAAVRKTGITLEALSLKNGLSKSTCRSALLKPIPTANNAIAEHLGVRLFDLWPVWWTKTGKRKYLRGNSTTKRNRDKRVKTTLAA